MNKQDMINELNNANELLRNVINLNRGIIRKLKKENPEGNKL